MKKGYLVLLKSSEAKITCSCCKIFSSLKFENELKCVLTKEKNWQLQVVDETFFGTKLMQILSKHVPIKKNQWGQIMRHNFKIKKAITQRSFIEKIYFRNRTENQLRLTWRLHLIFCHKKMIFDVILRKETKIDISEEKSQ